MAAIQVCGRVERGMESFFEMAELQSVLLIYLLVGYICNKLDIINRENQGKFVDLLVNVLCPVMVFNSFKSITFDMLISAGKVLLVSFAICVIAWVVGRVLYRRFPENEQPVLRYATMVNNAGFAGLPLAQQAFGDEGMLYASVYLVPLRFFVWSAGVAILSGEKASFSQTLKKVVTNPCVIAVPLGLIRGFLGVEFPSPIETALTNLTTCVSPLSMIVMGAFLGDVDIRHVVTPDVLFFCLIRLIVFPLVTFGLCTLLGAGEVVSGTCMLLTAMPAGSGTALLSAQYGADEVFGAKLVFVSTILSLVTAPLLMLLL